MGTGTAADGTANKSSSIGMIVMMVGLMVVMYFVMIRPQKKKQQEEQKLRDSVQIGDEVTTIGGINGRVVTVKEDSIVLETGADRTKLKFMRWAIQTNNTANERAESEKAAFEAAKAAEKEEKKSSKRRSKKSDEE
ncbi:MAG: preprotein translocase subunit YajC [Ruminococcaceae bacterium]|nr:preprotein translocase subunit YajC [Oscillospiraceae bacterium]MBR3597016.1 preprotein translocase subunit YajC [Clostridia bacterium]